MNEWMHKEYPKTCKDDDFWGQIKRTVNGKPVSQDQIDIIISSIKKELLLNKDTLLDIACGNGALSKYFFNDCSFFLGIDFSEHLIKIAKKYFEVKPNYIFKEFNIKDYFQTESEPEKYTKCLCYGAFSYFSKSESDLLLDQLYNKFKNLKILYIGNLPDLDNIHNFSTEYKYDINDHCSPLGIWRTKNQFYNMCKQFGWSVDFQIMPLNFYASSYRYDAILRKNK